MKEKVYEDGTKAAKTPLMIYYAKIYDNILWIRARQNERQQFAVLHHWYSAWRSAETIHQCSIGWLYSQKSKPRTPCRILKLSINGVLKIFGLVSRVSQKRYGRSYIYSKNSPPL